MQKFIIKLSFILISNLVFSFSFAQERKTIDLEIGVDIPKLLISLDPFQQKYEGEIGISFNQGIILVLQPGYRYQKFDKHNYDYKVEGSYLRTGIFFQTGRSSIMKGGMGFLFSASSFSDWAVASLRNSFWGDFDEETEKRNHMSYWIEIPFMIKWKIKKYFYFKLIWSNRFLIKNPRDNEGFPVYTVVGYGSTQYIFMPALTTTVGFTFPFKK